MSTNQNPSDPPTMTTLLGGEEITVTKLDGTTEVVKVRQLPISLYPALGAVIDDELRMVELFCDRPAGWAETLAIKSYEAVIELGERINEGFFGWPRRKQARAERVLPGITEKVRDNAARLQPGSVSGPPNAGSPSSRLPGTPSRS